MKVRTTVPKPHVVRDMEKMAKAIGATTGDYVSLRIEVIAYDTGSARTRFTVYTPKEGFSYHDNWLDLLTEVRRRADGRNSK